MSPFVKLSSSSDAAVKSKQAAAPMEKTTLDTPVKTFSLWLEGSHCQIECEGGKLSDKTTFFFFLKHVEEGVPPPRQEKPTRFLSRQIKYIYLFPQQSSKQPSSCVIITTILFFPLFIWLLSRLILKSSLCRAVAHGLLHLSCYWAAKKMEHQLEKVAPAGYLHKKWLLSGKNVFKYFFCR